MALRNIGPAQMFSFPAGVSNLLQLDPQTMQIRVNAAVLISRRSRLNVAIWGRGVEAYSIGA